MISQSQEYKTLDFTVITCTGDRPEVFELCKRYIQRQTVLPAQWIIVDDGKVPVDRPDFAFTNYIRRIPKSTDPQHTLPVQLLEALKRVKYTKIVMMEDDDWYAPMYCEESLRLLDIVNLVGRAYAVYYKIPALKYSVRDNQAWSCWNETCFTIDVAPQLVNLINENLNDFCVDLAAWRQLNVKKRIFIDAKKLCVGMKGLPGRFGLGMGHGATPKFKDDQNHTFLKKLIGADVILYQKWLGKENAPGNCVQDIVGLRK